MAPTPIIKNVTSFNCNPIGSFASGRKGYRPAAGPRRLYSAVNIQTTGVQQQGVLALVDPEAALRVYAADAPRDLRRKYFKSLAVDKKTFQYAVYARPGSSCRPRVICAVAIVPCSADYMT